MQKTPPRKTSNLALKVAASVTALVAVMILFTAIWVDGGNTEGNLVGTGLFGLLIAAVMFIALAFREGWID